MLKKSDLFTSLTKKPSFSIWKNDWDNTIYGLYDARIDDFNKFLTPGVLETYLPPNNKENYYERVRILRRLFDAIQNRVSNALFRNDNDPEVLSLLMKLVFIKKLYDQIPDENKSTILIFGLDPTTNLLYKIANNFGYDALTYLAQNFHFSPNYIMQVARNYDIRNNDPTGREKLVKILAERYNSFLPIYDWLSSPEKTLEMFGSYNMLDQSGYELDENEDKRHIFYPYEKTSVDLNLTKIRDSLATIMDSNEKTDFILQLMHTNDAEKPILKIPDVYGFKTENAFDILRKMYQNGDLSYFLKYINGPIIQKVLNEENHGNYWKLYDQVIDSPSYNILRKLIFFYQLIKTIINLYYDEEGIEIIKDLFNNNFKWVNLKNNESAALNGFGTPEKLKEYFTENPELTHQCRVDFLGKKEIINNFKNKQKEDISSQANLYEYAFKNYGFTYYNGINNIGEISDFLEQEAPKIGVSANELIEYGKHIKVYIVNIVAWSLMCKRALRPNNRFLGVNLNKNAGVFLTESIDHLGNTSPVIICRNDIGSKGPISIFFENLGINKEEINRLTLAHEGAHALHYLADPSMTTNGTPYGAGNPDMASYVGNIIENIAYAHGTLPYFYNLVIGHIGDMLGEPIVQQAVQEWIMTNIIMSDDAPLQGIYNSKHIMRQAVIMQEKFGTDIVQYIEKKKKRQIQKVLDLIKQNQQENKSEILKDIVAEENKLKLQLRKLDKRGNYYSKSQQLTQKLNELKQRKKLIMQNKLNIDLSDAAEALAEGYIKQYFFEINKQFLEQNKQVGDITPEELTEHSRWLMDATFGGTGEYRPLTTEILPFTTTKIDKSGGFYPHLQEEANVNKLIKIANKADKLGLLALSKEIDKIILV